MRQSKHSKHDHYTLSKPEVMKAKVVLVFTVLGLLMQRIDKAAGHAEATNAAYSYCTKSIDETISDLPQHVRQEIERRMNRARVKLTAEVKDIGLEAGFLAMLRFIDEGNIKYKQGTIRAFTLENMKGKREVLETTYKGSQKDIQRFMSAFKRAVKNL